LIVLGEDIRFGESNEILLIVDHDDSKWLLLRSVLELTTPRKAKQEMSKQGITPVENTGSARVFPEIMDELKRRKIIRDEDLVVFDRGYYSYRNYALDVREYKVVPLIFPKKTF